MKPPPLDTVGRPLEALRISVTDQCNLRCTYCMPKAAFVGHAFLEQNQLLTFEEITLLTEIFVDLGVRKIRLTGGEPLLRPQIADLVHRLASQPRPPELALSTNGVLLREHARALREAGLTRVNVSLDALDDRIFGGINGVGRPVADVLDGIDAALEQSLFVKVNMVVQRGINEQQILPMARHFAARRVPLRFIEFMDVGNCNKWNRQLVVPGSEILALLGKDYDLLPEDAHPADVDRRYICRDTGAEFGFINSITAPFCRGCNRLRLSADGEIYACLFAKHGLNLRDLVRGGATKEEIAQMVRHFWRGRDDRYSELRAAPKSKDIEPKVEMSYIGG
jgi:GTP 3',8-cyclase